MMLFKYRCMFAVVLFAGIAVTPLSAQTTKEDVARSIDIQKLRHPYLFFSNEEKPEIRKRIQSDPESRDIMKRLVAEGNRFLRRPFQKKVLYQAAHPRFEAETDALPYLTDISNGAITLAFLYQMTGDENTRSVRSSMPKRSAMCPNGKMRLTRSISFIRGSGRGTSRMIRSSFHTISMPRESPGCCLQRTIGCTPQ